MDSGLPNTGNEGYANANNGMFANNQQFIQYDNLFSSGNEFSASNDASWGLNASGFHNDQSRAPPSATPSWQQNVNHLSAPATQHAYDGTSSPYGRALNQSPAPYVQPNFGAVNGQNTYPYRQQQFDTSLINQGNNGHAYTRPFASAGHSARTISPQALNQTSYMPQTAHSAYQNRPSAVQQQPQQQPQPQQQQQQQQQARRVNHTSLANSVPKGADAGMFSIISFDHLSRTTNSERLGNYVNVGKEPLEWDITRSVIPAYFARRSRNELRKAAGTNQLALAKIGKKSRTLAASSGAKAASTSSEQIRYEQSSSEDSSSSDDESDYSDEDVDPDSPLPANRPDSPKGGVEYDVIKALWRSKRKSIDAATIRTSLADFWEIIKTIRDRWKADIAALTDAEEKKKTGELPLLRSRVKDQREMAEAAFRAAFKHGHRAIVELLSENISLVFILYQFLIERMKADDLNGSLSRAILELMAAFTTLTETKLEKVHLDKVLPRFQKKGDAKTQFWAKKILSNSELATKEAVADDQKKSARPADGATGTTKADAVRKLGPEPVAGVKRAASSTADGGASKKVATVTAKSNGVTATTRITGNAGTKKLGETARPATAAGAGATKKTVVAKPSGFFSSLQSAAKKPGTSNAERTAKPVAAKVPGSATTAATAKPAFSFAETMANLAKPKKEEVKPVKQEAPAQPEETPEERSKRMRKEQRRRLHVSFKTGEDLVEVRYFTHDPDEEIDHGSSQMRDMADVGGEGRMLKQKHQMMDLDDDEDSADEETKLVEFHVPSQVDFSMNPDLDKNWAPRGGGSIQPNSNERAKRDQYESSTLMVYYTNPSEIPPNPKEPENPYNGDQGGPVKMFGSLDDKWVARARDVAARRHSTQFQPHHAHGPVSQPAPGYDFSAQQPQVTPDVQSILESLKQIAAQQQPTMPTYAPPYMGTNGFQPPPPPLPQPAAVPAANIDLAAILAQIQQPQQQTFGQQGQAAQPPNYRTKVCRFFQAGKCDKGDACSYLHQ